MFIYTVFPLWIQFFSVWGVDGTKYSCSVWEGLKISIGEMVPGVHLPSDVLYQQENDLMSCQKCLLSSRSLFVLVQLADSWQWSSGAYVICWLHSASLEHRWRIYGCVILHLSVSSIDVHANNINLKVFKCCYSWVGSFPCDSACDWIRLWGKNDVPMAPCTALSPSSNHQVQSTKQTAQQLYYSSSQETPTICCNTTLAPVY